MQIKARYRSEDGLKAYISITAPRELCKELDTIVCDFLSEKGFNEQEYRGRHHGK